MRNNNKIFLEVFKDPDLFKQLTSRYASNKGARHKQIQIVFYDALGHGVVIDKRFGQLCGVVEGRCPKLRKMIMENQIRMTKRKGICRMSLSFGQYYGNQMTTSLSKLTISAKGIALSDDDVVHHILNPAFNCFEHLEKTTRAENSRIQPKLKTVNDFNRYFRYEFLQANQKEFENYEFNTFMLADYFPTNSGIVVYDFEPKKERLTDKRLNELHIERSNR